MKAIQWIHKTSVDIEEDELKEQVPHIEENAWLLLSILVKVIYNSIYSSLSIIKEWIFSFVRIKLNY